MSYQFIPHDLAIAIIDKSKINENAEIYNEDGGIVRAQLTAITAISNIIGTYKDDEGNTTTLKNNAYKTIHRLEHSKNKDKIDFDKNLINTLTGTISSALMNSLKNSEEAKVTMIKWMPSTAKIEDLFHALNYGKIMTMKEAISKGLGVRYNCQCGMLILKNKDSMKIESKLNIKKLL